MIIDSCENHVWRKARRVNLEGSFLESKTQKYGINSLKLSGSVVENNLIANLKNRQFLPTLKPLLIESGSLPCTCPACRTWKVFDSSAW